MSDIPKSEQSWSPLETQHLCYKLRRRINSELLFSFGYSDKHLIKYIAKLTESIKDRKERNKRMRDLYEQMSAYSHWLIEAERDDVASLTRDIVRHLRKANTIWPTYYSEYCERRVELDRAREACNALEDELQYLAESLPADKNRYTSIVLDVEIRQMYRGKVDPELNAHVSRKFLTGKKMLKKGVDIGNRVSQCSGIVHPYRIDNYLKIVRGCKYMSRYTDDTRLMHPSKEFLEECLRQIRKQTDQIGVIVNEKKTRIQPLRKPFRHLQIMYIPKGDGTVVRKINPKSITRERHKLKAYRRLLDDGRMSYPEVENAFKSWLCTNCNVMSWRQIHNLGALYLSLFGRRPTWKRKHSRLTWLMTHRSPAWSSTATAISAVKR